jgi:multisubunit Na+/H+ antiporter MnhG subunit
MEISTFVAIGLLTAVVAQTIIFLWTDDGKDAFQYFGLVVLVSVFWFVTLPVVSVVVIAAALATWIKKARRT